MLTTVAYSDLATFSTTNTITSAGGDYVMMFLYQSGTSIAIFKRNSDGFYNLVNTINTASAVSGVATNGNWFSYVLSTGSAQIFQLNGGSIVNTTSYSNAGLYTNILSDDSVLFLDTSSIKTYQLVSGSWTSVDTSSVTLPASTMYPPYHLTDTTFAIYESGTSLVKLYTRNNSSWVKQDQFSFSTQVSRIIWTGDDTVVLTNHLSASDPQGTVWIYVKVNNVTWTNVNTTTATDIGVTTVGYFGQSVALLDQNNIAVSAPFDGIDNARFYDSGSVFLLTRSGSGSWSYSARLRPLLRGPVYGSSLATSGRDLLIGQCALQTDVNAKLKVDCSFHPLPLCFQEPINVTCNDVTFDTCTTFPSLSGLEMFTVNNPLCGTTASNLDRVQFSGASLVVDMTFTRNYVAPATCNITLTCPSAPVVRAPDGSVVPVAPQPGKTPSSSSVSSAVTLSSFVIANLLSLLLIVQ